MLFNKTRQYNKQIVDKIIFFKATETNKLLILFLTLFVFIYFRMLAVLLVLGPFP